MEVSTIPVEPPLAAPMSIASLLLGQATRRTETTVAATAATTHVTHTVTSVSAAAAPAAPDTRRQLDDGDITYAIRLAPTPNANTITDALLASYRTPLTRPQLLHIVQLLICLLYTSDAADE